MRILALIPARGGSKRVPGKNIRPLGGKPLIGWSIDAAKGIEDISDILVSTDDSEIAAASRDCGASVPWLRPDDLATDTASSMDVVIHALDRYEEDHGEVDGVLLLQPTSPFRKTETIRRGIDLFAANEQRPVIGVSATHAHPMWCLKIEGGHMRPFMEQGGLHLRSQDLPPAYVPNGAFYLISPEDARTHRSFYADSMVPLIMDDPIECIDIDTEWDWKMAEAVLR